MLELIILWTYILIFNLAAGCVLLGITDRLYLRLFTSGKAKPVSTHRQDHNIDSPSSSVTYGLPGHSFMGLQLAGIAIITLYAETVGIFGKVYMGAHLVLLVAVSAIIIAGSICGIHGSRSDRSGRSDAVNLSQSGSVKASASGSKSFDKIKQFCCDIGFCFTCQIKAAIHVLFSWEGVLIVILVVATAYFASRGNFHTDTCLYHAEMIRWYEEYGCVTGMANLQNHFGYNSAYLGYAAFFSMRWLTGQSLHGTGGFLQALLVTWSVSGLIRWKEHKNHAVDACYLAIIIYAIINSEYINSPATDFGALYLCLMIITLWVRYATGDHVSQSIGEIYVYGMLCVAICLATTYKLAVGLMVVAVIYPAVKLIRNHQWKLIFFFLGMGVLVLLPWIIRNIKISGCIIYPLDWTRLSFLDWAVSSRYLADDNAGISCWGKCLFDRDLVDAPMSTWLPLWWDAKMSHEKMLIISAVLSCLMEFLWVVRNAVICLRARKISPLKSSVNSFENSGALTSGSDLLPVNYAMLSLKLGIAACLIIWFVQAPFIRYGLCFLLVLPLIEVSQWAGLLSNRVTPSNIIGGFGIAAILLSFFIYLDYYTLYDVVWAKEHIRDNYYLTQEDYPSQDYEVYDMDGMEILYPAEYSEDNNYAPIPSTAYKEMAERTTLRGDTLKDGFKAK